MKKSSPVNHGDPPEDPLDSMEDVARRVNCHPRTIARAVAAGALRPVRFTSRLVRFRRSEVERWIKQAEGGE